MRIQTAPLPHGLYYTTRDEQDYFLLDGDAAFVLPGEEVRILKGLLAKAKKILDAVSEAEHDEGPRPQGKTLTPGVDKLSFGLFYVDTKGERMHALVDDKPPALRAVQLVAAHTLVDHAYITVANTPTTTTRAAQQRVDAFQYVYGRSGLLSAGSGIV